MTSELTQLRNELEKSNTNDTNFLRGIIASLIKDKPVHNLLIQCLNAGILQDFFHEATHDSSFIDRCRTKLIEDFFINETAADLAISYCTFLIKKQELIKKKEQELIPFRKGDKWGFCNQEKTIIIECKYCEVTRFIEGMALVKGSEQGFIDTTGKKIIDFDIYDEYVRVHCFSEGLALIILDDNYSFIDKHGKWLQWRLNCNFVDSFSEGLAQIERKGKFGFIDKNGQEVITCKYDGVWHFNEGAAQIIQNYKYGSIDKEGSEIIACRYDWAGSFHEGLARVEFAGKYGFIDQTGKEIAKCIYDSVCTYVEGKRLYNRTLTGYYKDKKMKSVYGGSDSADDFSEGLAPVKLNGHWRYIDKTGQEIIVFKDIITECRKFIEGLAPIKQNEKWGFIDKRGTVVIPFKYEWVDSFHDGLAGVSIEEKCGFIDINGTEVIECKYDEVRCFLKGIAWVGLGEKYDDESHEINPDYFGIIDKNGIEYWDDIKQ